MEDQLKPDQHVKETGKAATSKTPETDPWDPIILSQLLFLNNLECLREMVDLVLPVLKNRDQERHERIEHLMEEIDSEKDKRPRLEYISLFKEFINHVQKIETGARIFRQSVITSIVSHFDEFITDILKISYRYNPSWLMNPDKKISYKKILEISSIDSLKDEIITKEINELMRDSHFQQVTLLDDKLKLGIKTEFPYWLDFLEITERRNLYIHTGGFVSLQYLENCIKWKASIDESVKEGAYLFPSDDYIQKAIDCFYELSVRVAQASVRRMFPDSFDKLDRLLNNTSVELLVQERWELAERIFKFALSIPERMTSRSFRYYFLINICIAKKFAGKNFKGDLGSVDWSPLHPMYHFAVSVLEDRFEDAERLMRSEAVREKVTEEDFKQWPLLKEFRKTEAFGEIYKEIFGKDFDEELLVEAKRFQAQQDGGLDNLSAYASES
jgi:hypothetical protein